MPGAIEGVSGDIGGFRGAMSIEGLSAIEAGDGGRRWEEVRRRSGGGAALHPRIEEVSEGGQEEVRRI